MKAAKLTDRRYIEIVDEPIPEIAEEEVLIRIRVCGLCASELPVWQNGPGGGGPISLGHEAVGIIVKTGEKVVGFREGDRVTGLMCNAFCEYQKVHASQIVKVGESLLDEEALGEPIACMMSGALRTPLQLGDSFALIGAGYFGLGFLQLMKLKGAARIIAVDCREEALEHALAMGADEGYLPTEIPKRYQTHFQQNYDQGIDVVAEAAGSQEALDLAVCMVRQHGILAIPGFHQSRRSVDMELLNWKAVTVINAHETILGERMEPMKRALRLMESGRFHTRELMTNPYRLEEINQAFRDMETKPSGYIKGYIKMDETSNAD